MQPDWLSWFQGGVGLLIAIGIVVFVVIWTVLWIAIPFMVYGIYCRANDMKARLQVLIETHHRVGQATVTELQGLLTFWQNVAAKRDRPDA